MSKNNQLNEIESTMDAVLEKLSEMVAALNAVTNAVNELMELNKNVIEQSDKRVSIKSIDGTEIHLADSSQNLDNLIKAAENTIQRVRQTTNKE